MVIHFVTHPEVVIDPAVPVPDWSLSPEGTRRMRAITQRPWALGIRSVFSSSERKATDAACILAEHLGLSAIILEGLAENDRRATGYLPREAFEAMADAFFAEPEQSVCGWERAIDAQWRIIAAVDRALSLAAPGGDVAIISHGAVGALLLCHLKGVAISRAEDQPGTGGGNVYAFDGDRRLISEWQRLEVYPAA
jgi:broad specificity phosphatase PhoE